MALSQPKLPSWEEKKAVPCLDSSNECVGKLTEVAIANSSKLKKLDEKIAILDQRLELMDSRIDYSQKKSWTNYVTLDPVRLLQNLFGGGDVQRDRIAIADLEIKTADLLAAKAELERGQEEIKSQLKEEVLNLVLEYEAAEREYVLAQSKLATYSQQRQITEINYRIGNGSTTEMLSLWQTGESLEQGIVYVNNKRSEIFRKLLQLTGYKLVEKK